MNKERTSHGFGLAVFSILLLATAFLTILYFSNALIASIIAFLSAIMAAAAYFEARRAKGPRTLALTILIITILGTFMILIWTDNMSKLTNRHNGSVIIQEQEPVVAPPADETKKMKDMEKVIEQLEADSTGTPPDTSK